MSEWIQLASNLGFAVCSAIAVGVALWKVMVRLMDSHFTTVDTLRQQLPLQQASLSQIKAETSLLADIKSELETQTRVLKDWPSDPEKICQAAEATADVIANAIAEAVRNGALPQCKAEEIRIAVEQAMRKKAN